MIDSELFNFLLPIFLGGVVASLATQLLTYMRERWSREESRREQQRNLIAPIIDLSLQLTLSYQQLADKYKYAGKLDDPIGSEMTEDIFLELQKIQAHSNDTLKARLGIIDPQAHQNIVDYRESYKRLLGLLAGGLSRLQEKHGDGATNDQALQLYDLAMKDMLASMRELLDSAEVRLSPQRKIGHRVSFKLKNLKGKKATKQREEISNDEAFQQLIEKHTEEIDKHLEDTEHQDK